ncbi:lisH domain-containing protein C1711.05-like [Archocentrus centrarchus]|uniref:lisH domain-containing protein C1711.05-like n=1 Tax=Archocentrus centrarchus TaxID=63155 RepID=UPI0011EA229A|nr:lisH domain-containing protein C1711.05-like [Archocentrus centrarchus]
MTYTSTSGEEELNNSSSEDELDSESSSTDSLLDMDIQENDNIDNHTDTEDHWSNTSSSENEDDELDTEKPTTSQLDVDVSELCHILKRT